MKNTQSLGIHDYELPKKPFGLKDDGYLYRFTRLADSQFNSDSGLIPNVFLAIIILSGFASAFTLAYLVYNLLAGTPAFSQFLLLAASVIPGTISIGFLQWGDTIGSKYINHRERLLKLLKQPMLNEDADAVRHLYDFIDFDRSTDTKLVFHNDSGQSFYTLQNARFVDNGDLIDAVRQYSKSERLSDNDIIERVRSIQNVAEHTRNDIQSQYLNKFHQNTITPVDTPYYRSLAQSQKNIEAEIKALTVEHSKNIKNNALIIEKIKKLNPLALPAPGQ